MTVTLCHLLYKKENPAQKTNKKPPKKTLKSLQNYIYPLLVPYADHIICVYGTVTLESV